MRKLDEKTGELQRVICNQCGKELLVNQGIVREGVFLGDSAFGYFSRKDGRLLKFDLCEDCYDELCKGFLIPVEVENRTELI